MAWTTTLGEAIKWAVPGDRIEYDSFLDGATEVAPVMGVTTSPEGKLTLQIPGNVLRPVYDRRIKFLDRDNPDNHNETPMSNIVEFFTVSSL